MVWLAFGLFAAVLVAGLFLFMWWGLRRFGTTPTADDRPSLGMGVVGRWVVVGIGVVIFMVGDKLARRDPGGFHVHGRRDRRALGLPE
jgi:O-antigen ligase